MQRSKWWQRAVFYQIYPRSFADGNGDGIGDLAGMREQLVYLHELGIEAIWLSPHYPSPLHDCGYDVADYTGVAPEYGSLDDFRALLEAAHALGIRVILDLVLNHSSDEHPWFRESRASRTNPRRDWYLWRDGKAGGPPNNWVSIFGGSAWTYDPARDQYYYHAFLPQQPDLNWRNPELKQAMWQAVRFWLELGVDGFRLDAISTIFEHPDLPDHPLPLLPEAILDINELAADDFAQVFGFQLKQPGLHELMRELRALVASYPGERVLVGEDDDVAFHGDGDDELHMVFNFPLMRNPRLTPATIRANQAERLAALPPGAWPCNTLGNHDTARVWSRYGDGAHDAQLARLHAALLLTLKGTPFLYNGEEIGMSNLQLERLDQIRDTAALHHYRMLTSQRGMAPEMALQTVLANTRDRCRSPLQWANAPNAGFCPPTSAPWLPVNPDYAEGVNIAEQAADPASLLNDYRQLIALRRSLPALLIGEYQALDLTSTAHLAYLRHDPASGQRCLVALNFSASPQPVQCGLGALTAKVAYSSHRPITEHLQLDQLMLHPFEVLIVLEPIRFK